MQLDELVLGVITDHPVGHLHWFIIPRDVGHMNYQCCTTSDHLHD